MSTLPEFQSEEAIEMVGEHANNINSLLPIHKTSSQYKVDINENEMIDEFDLHTKVPPVPIPVLINHDGGNTTLPTIARRDVVFFNRYILIRLLLTLLTLLMMLLCILYAIGQITTLTIPDFICVNKTIEEIRKHSQEYNLPHGTTSGCWTSKGVKANQDLLFQNRAYKSSWIDVKENPQDIDHQMQLVHMHCIVFVVLMELLNQMEKKDVKGGQCRREAKLSSHLDSRIIQTLGGLEQGCLSLHTTPAQKRNNHKHSFAKEICDETKLSERSRRILLALRNNKPIPFIDNKFKSSKVKEIIKFIEIYNEENEEAMEELDNLRGDILNGTTKSQTKTTKKQKKSTKRKTNSNHNSKDDFQQPDRKRQKRNRLKIAR